MAIYGIFILDYIRAVLYKRRLLRKANGTNNKTRQKGVFDMVTSNEMMVVRMMDTNKIVRYQWSEDGEAELCSIEGVILKEETECYHCAQPIPINIEAVQLISIKDEAIYILHKKCANKGCY